MEELRKIITEFCNSAPERGFEEVYLNRATEIYALYQDAVFALENGDNEKFEQIVAQLKTN